MSLDADAVLQRVAALRAMEGVPGEVPPLWDGKAAERIVAVLERSLQPVAAA